MALHEQAQKLLDGGKGLPALESLSVIEARARLFEAFRTKGEKENIHSVEDTTIPGPAGGIPIRIYTPSNGKDLPVMVYFHGGGGVVNSIETHDAISRSLTNLSGCIVVSVEYRLAPESKYPAALEDAYASLCWVVNNSAKLNCNADRVAVGGDSSGGGLAAGVAMLARDRRGPKISFQLLIYPVTDYFVPETKSYKENGTGYSLTKSAMAWFFENYLPVNCDLNDPYLFPLRAASLKDLPPAFIMTAEFDPLRDEGEAYAEKLMGANVPVVLKRYDGMMHGFIIMSKFLDTGKEGLKDASVALNRALSQK